MSGIEKDKTRRRNI
jgi:zinc finger CCCH domain-containing protein 13